MTEVKSFITLSQIGSSIIRMIPRSLEEVS